MRSWKTSVLGLAVAVSAWSQVVVALLDGVSSTVPGYGLALSLTVAALGFLFAKDSNK